MKITQKKPVSLPKVTIELTPTEAFDLCNFMGMQSQGTVEALFKEFFDHGYNAARTHKLTVEIYNILSNLGYEELVNEKD